MADFAPQVSSQYSDRNAGTLVHGAYWGGHLYAVYAKLTFTAAGFGTGIAKLSMLPPGKKLIFPDLSRIICPQGTATATLDIGLGAYTKASDGSTVNATPTALMSAGAVGAGALDQAPTLPATAFLEIDSGGPVDVTARVNTANSPAAGDLEVLVVFAMID